MGRRRLASEREPDMNRGETIRRIRSLNASLDVRFLESLSRVELESYAEHLQAVRRKTGRTKECVPAPTTTG